MLSTIYKLKWNNSLNKEKLRLLVSPSYRRLCSFNYNYTYQSYGCNRPDYKLAFRLVMPSCFLSHLRRRNHLPYLIIGKIGLKFSLINCSFCCYACESYLLQVLCNLMHFQASIFRKANKKSWLLCMGK